MLLLFVYPFLYGLVLSFNPKDGGWLANYRFFFTTDNEWPTIWTTLRLALPATLINVGLALPIAYRMRVKSTLPALGDDPAGGADHAGHGADRRRHADLLRAEGLACRISCSSCTSTSGPIRLTHNYWGVLISLVVSGFPFAFLLILSYVTGIDPVLARAAATLGAGTRGPVPPHLPAAARARTCHVLLSGVRAGILGVPLRCPARLSCRTDARDLHRCLRGGVRTVRLRAGIGNRHGHGSRAAGRSSPRCSACATPSTAGR